MHPALAQQQQLLGELLSGQLLAGQLWRRLGHWLGEVSQLMGKLLRWLGKLLVGKLLRCLEKLPIGKLLQ